MRIYRLPVRETCRASNAFNLRRALLTAFRTESTSAEASAVTIRNSNRSDKPATGDNERSAAQKSYRISDSVRLTFPYSGKSFTRERQSQWGVQPPATPNPRATYHEQQAKSVGPQSLGLERQPRQPDEELIEDEHLHKEVSHLLAVKNNDQSAGEEGSRHPDPERPESVFRFVTFEGPESAETDAARKVRKLEAGLDGPDRWRRHMRYLASQAYELTRQDTSSFSEHEKAQFEYRPRQIPVEPSSGLLSQTSSIPWAMSPAHATETDALDVLEHEISHFMRYAEPTVAEIAARKAVTETMFAFIRAKTQGNPVRTEVFGSEATGLTSATSDIDIRIYRPPPAGAEPNYAAMAKLMRRLSAHMSQSKDWSIVVNRPGRYPIINAQHRESGIDVQVVSAPSTHKQQEYTAKYLAEIPHLRPLFFVFRTMLAMRGLITVFYGGTGSYGLFMMLVASLKRRSSQPATKMTAAQQLLHFLDFYAFFPARRHGLSIEPTGKLFMKHDGADATPIHAYAAAAYRRDDPVRAGQWAIGQRRPLQPYLLCLQDPADPKNDLGRKTNAIKHVIATIKYVRHAVHRQMGQVRAAPASSPPSEEQRPKSKSRKRISLLLALVGRCHEVYHDRRAKVEAYGRQVLEKAAQGDELVDTEGDGKAEDDFSQTKQSNDEQRPDYWEEMAKWEEPSEEDPSKSETTPSETS